MLQAEAENKRRGCKRAASPHENHPFSLPVEASCLDFCSVLVFMDMVYVWIHQHTIITHNVQSTDMSNSNPLTQHLYTVTVQVPRIQSCETRHVEINVASEYSCNLFFFPLSTKARPLLEFLTAKLIKRKLEGKKKNQEKIKLSKVHVRN